MQQYTSVSVAWNYPKGPYYPEPSKGVRCLWAASLLPGVSTQNVHDLIPPFIPQELGNGYSLHMNWFSEELQRSTLSGESYQKRLVSRAKGRTKRKLQAAKGQQTLPGIVDHVTQNELAKPKYELGRCVAHQNEAAQLKKKLLAFQEERRFCDALEAITGKPVVRPERAL